MNRLIIAITACVLSCISAPEHGLANDATNAVPKTVAEARKQFEEADAELNRVYRQCYAGEIVQSQSDLQQAQRMWVQCRDSTAAAFQKGETGRGLHEDNYYLYALTVLTQNRIKELKQLFFP